MENSRAASFLFLALLAVSSFITSCNSSPAASTIMDPGSTFTVQELNNGSLTTIVYTVFATAVTNPNTHAKAIGLSGQRSDNNAYDTMYWAYETNGDISIYPNPSSDPKTWWTLPFVSRTGAKTPYTTGQPNPSYDTTSIDWSGAGAAFPLSGQTYSTDSATVTLTQLFTQNPPAVQSLFHYTYLPSIGIIGIEDADNGAQDRVISYSLK